MINKAFAIILQLPATKGAMWTPTYTYYGETLEEVAKAAELTAANFRAQQVGRGFGATKYKVWVGLFTHEAIPPEPPVELVPLNKL
jgi:hypothetical protein